MAVVPSGGRAQAIVPFREAQLTEAVAGDFLTDPMHTLEDYAWQNLSSDPYGYQQALDFQPMDRKLQVTRARHYWRTYPLAKQAVRLYCTYVLGQGVSYHCENEQVQAVLDDFWSDYDNQIALTGQPAQRMLMTRQRVDGEVILYLFTDDDGRVKVRPGEPLEITTVITDPDDALRPLYYERQWTPKTFQYGGPGADGQGSQVGAWQTAREPRVDYYADVANAELPNRPLRLQEARVIHDKINALGQRGVSDLYAALDWLSAQRVHTEDHATIAHALSMFSWNKKVKGGPPQVAASAALERSSISGLGGAALGFERNPPYATGSIATTNSAVDWEPVKVETGAANAEITNRILTTQVGACVGIMLHYFGDGGDANLATATAMDLPMLKLFEDGQTAWKALMQRIVQYVVVQAIKAGRIDGTVQVRDNVETPVLADDSPIDIDFPLIVQRDTWAMTQSLSAMKTNGGIASEEYARQCGTLLAVDDIDTFVEKAMDEKQQQDLQAQQMQQAQMQVLQAKAQPPASPGADSTPGKPTTPATNPARPAPGPARNQATTRP